MSDWYILDGKTLVKAELLEGARWFEKNNQDRVVAKTTVGDAEVSTVFLALDHQFNPGGPPLVFETLIFGGEHDQDMWRYSTWEEAEEGHRRAVNMLKSLPHSTPEDPHETSDKSGETDEKVGK